MIKKNHYSHEFSTISHHHYEQLCIIRESETGRNLAYRLVYVDTYLLYRFIMCLVIVIVLYMIIGKFRIFFSRKYRHYIR